MGGSGSVEEIYDKVVELEKLPDDILSQLHDPEKSNQTEVGYRLAWARTYLKKYGLLENSTRGVWALTAKAKEKEQVDPQDVVRTVRSLDKKESPKTVIETSVPPEVSQEDEWKQKLQEVQGILPIKRNQGLSWCHGGAGRQGTVYHDGNFQSCCCEGGDT